jgi:predicted permease
MLLPEEDRGSFPAELAELYRIRTRRRGRSAARRWYRMQVLRLACYRTMHRLGRALAGTTTRSREGTMETMGRDIGYAVRRLLRTPGFTAVAVLSLALGIGANTAIFSVVNTVLLAKPPYEAPGDLVYLYTSDADGGSRYGTFSQPDVRELAETSEGVFEGVVSNESFLAVAGRGEAARVTAGEAISPSAFETLGVGAHLGRTFSASEDGVRGGSPVALLGHATWVRNYGADPDVLGRSLRVNQGTFTVVGVLPPWFTGSFPAVQTGVFVPLPMIDEVRGGGSVSRLDQRGSRSAFVMARLAPGVTPDRAQAWLDSFAAAQAERWPESNEGRSMTLVPLADVAIHPEVDRALKPVGLLLLGVVGLVLLIACVNLASFLLARAEARRAEMAVRLSLGASRAALVRQLMVETVLLGLLGGLAGLLVGRWAIDLLVSFRPPIPIPLMLDFPLDGRVVGYTAVVSVGAGMLFGLVPALQATGRSLSATLGDAVGRGGSGSGGRLRSGLVTLQVALSMTLLVGSGLFLRSLQEARGMDPGFYTGSAAILWPNLELAGLEPEEGRAFWTELEDRLLADARVSHVAFTDALPLGFSVQSQGIVVPDRPNPDTHEGYWPTDFAWVSPTYFRTLEVELLTGTGFPRGAGPDDARSVIVSRAFAERHLPEGAVGRTLATEGGRELTVVGVAEDTKVRTLGEEPRPRIYFNADQAYMDAMQVVVRGEGSGPELLRLARETALALRPDVVLFDQTTMEEHTALHLFPARMAALLLSAFGGLALLLAAVGVWGVVSHAVVRRTREVGIRLSLGATGAEMIGLLVRGGLRPVLLGSALGLAAAAGVGVLVSRFLYGVGGLDPVTFAAIPLVLVGVALGAAWLPARRAARVDPVQALRVE